MSMRITRFEIRNAQSELIAIHPRHDHDDGQKSFTWERPGGASGLGGLPTAQLPLYGSQDVADWSPDEPILLVEGEKSRDALKAFGFKSLATVTGAASCPDLGPLAVLAGRKVILWPDADDPGRRHMRKLAKQLIGLAASVQVFEWAEAPEHGDAADYLVSGSEAAERLHVETAGARSASEWLTSEEAPAGASGIVSEAFGALPEKPSHDDVTAALRRVVEASRDGDKLFKVALRHEAAARLRTLEFTPQAVLDFTRAAFQESDAVSSKMLQGKELTLDDPEPWPEPVDGAPLADEIAATFRKYVALPPGADVALTLWTLHAHAHDAAQVSPILAIVSVVMRCGKTTAMQVQGAMVPRPLIASNLTPAVLFRSVESYRPTLLIDEADTFLPDNEDLRGILNAGHVRGSAVVPRCVGEEFEPRLFSTWCPKVIAMIGRLPETLQDRSIVIQLQRKAKGTTVARLRLDRLEEFDPLRRRAWRWAQDQREALRDADPNVPGELHDRAQDNWRPLFAIADALGGEWPARAREAALALAAAAPESDSAGEMILADIRTMFEETGTDRLSSEAIVKALGDREDRPWREWKKGNALTVIQLARLLKPFGVGPRTIRLDDRTRLKGYHREQFEDLWDRYLSLSAISDPLPRDNAIAMQVERESRSVNGGTSVTNGVHAEGPSNGACHDVTGQNGVDRGVQQEVDSNGF